MSNTEDWRLGRSHVIREWANAEYDPSAPELVRYADPGDQQLLFKSCVQVIERTLGSWWLKRELAYRATKRGGILGLDLPGEDIPPDALNRLLALAYELHEAQGIPGFPAFVRGLRARSLVDATAEMWAVRHCIQAGATAVRFIDPNDWAGKSPDAVVTLSGRTVHVEVKARSALPVPEFAAHKIISTLGHARKQLPAPGPSMIYLKVPPTWSSDEVILSSIIEASEQFLSTTTRVNAVVLMLEQWLHHASGMAVRTATLAVPSENPAVHLPDTQGGWVPPAPETTWRFQAH